MSKLILALFIAFASPAYAAGEMCFGFFAKDSREVANPESETRLSPAEIADQKQAIQDFASLERDALKIMQRIDPGKKHSNEAAQVEVREWFDRLKNKQRSGEPLNVLEHTAIQLVLRTNVFKGDPDATLISEMQQVLTQSWRDLTGESRSFDEVLNKQLPKAVLKTQDIRVRRFHQLAYDIDPVTYQLRDRFAGQNLLSKIFPVALVATPPALALLSRAFEVTGGSHLSGDVIAVTVGLSITSIMEYIYHETIMHANVATIKRWQDKADNSKYTGWFYGPIAKMARSHNAHHSLLQGKRQTYTQIPPDPALLKQIFKTYRMNEAEQREFIEDTKHGVIMEKGAARLTLVFMATLSAAVDHFVFGGNAIQSIMAASAGVLLVPHVNIVHSKMHVRRTDVENQPTPSMIALMKKKFKQRFLDSFYFRTLSRVHFGHHIDQNTNYGILPSNVDAALGKQSRMTLSDLVDAYFEDIYM